MKINFIDYKRYNDVQGGGALLCIDTYKKEICFALNLVPLISGLQSEGILLPVFFYARFVRFVQQDPACQMMRRGAGGKFA